MFFNNVSTNYMQVLLNFHFISYIVVYIYQLVEEYKVLKFEKEIQYKDSKWRMYLKMLPGF